jgi:hypothetical protein
MPPWVLQFNLPRDIADRLSAATPLGAQQSEEDQKAPAPANGNGNQSPKLQGSDRQESLQNQLISDQQQQLLERDGTALPNGERGRPPACIAACFQLVAFNSMLDSLCCLHMTRWPMPHPPARPPAQPCLLQATPPSPSSLSTASFVS